MGIGFGEMAGYWIEQHVPANSVQKQENKSFQSAPLLKYFIVIYAATLKITANFKGTISSMIAGFEIAV